MTPKAKQSTIYEQNKKSLSDHAGEGFFTADNVQGDLGFLVGNATGGYRHSM